LPEGGFVGAVPNKPFLILEFEVEALNLDPREAGSTVSGDITGSGDRFVRHHKP